MKLVDARGKEKQYEVYFSASKSGRGKGIVKLFVQSGYVRTRGKQPQKKAIGLFIILFNTKTGKPITIQP